MLTPAQIRLRRTGLTATDMCRLSGENPYGAPIDVWADKKRTDAELLLSVPERDPRSMSGDLMEAPIARRYTIEYTPPGLRLRIVQTRRTYRHENIRWALATPDRFVFVQKEKERVSTAARSLEVLVGAGVATDPDSRASLVAGLSAGRKASWLLECKLVGSRLSKYWDITETRDLPDCDRVPPYVYCQVQWQMFVCGYDRVDVAALLYGTTFRAFRILRDEAYIDALVQIGDAFWKRNVLGNVPPPPDGSRSYASYLAQLYPNARRLMRDAPQGAVEIVRDYKAASEREQAAKRQKEKFGQALKAIIREADGIQGPWGYVTWLNTEGHVDWEALARDKGIDEETVGGYRRSGARKLRVVFTPEIEDRSQEVF